VRNYTQVRLHVPARINGTWSARHTAYVLEPQQLPFFVDSDWSLDFGLPSVPLDRQQQMGCEGGESEGGGAGGTQRLQGGGKDSCGASEGDRKERGGQGEGVCQAKGLGSRVGSEGAFGRHAASHVPAHALHMVLYIPPPSKRPVRLLESRDGRLSETNSFWIPHWGGVHVLPGDEGAEGEREGEREGKGDETAEERGGAKGEHNQGDPSQGQQAGNDEGRALGQELSPGALHGFAQVAAAQLRGLLGLEAYPEASLQPSSSSRGSNNRGSSNSSKGGGVEDSPAVRVLPALETGFAQWEVDMLLVRGA